MTRYNSSIKVKCKCSPDCDKPYTFGCKGYFYDHMPEDVKGIVGTKRKVAQKNYNNRRALGRKLHVAQKVANKKEEGTPAWKVELFFHAAAIELANRPYCEECGTWIPPNLYRAATAHVLPKRDVYGFPSVAAHPKNRLFLCGINGCHDRTHVWSKFATMKVWPKAVEAFKEMYPYIAVEELKNLPIELLETLVIDNSLNI